MHVWFENKGTNSLVANLTWKDGNMSKQYGPITVAPGGQHLFDMYYEDGAGLNGRWTFTVSPKNGGNVDMQVHARQFIG